MAFCCAWPETCGLFWPAQRARGATMLAGALGGRDEGDQRGGGQHQKAALSEEPTLHRGRQDSERFVSMQ